MALLVLLKSPPDATSPLAFPLDMGEKSQLVIGRQKEHSGTHPPADIVIDDGKMSVSRHHCVITCVNNVHFFVMNIARCAMYINTQQFAPNMPPKLLKNGDRLKICDFLFQFVQETPSYPVPQDIPTGLPDPADEPEPGSDDGLLSSEWDEEIPTAG
jgi:predicted component of type VI protein secretion system